MYISDVRSYMGLSVRFYRLDIGNDCLGKPVIDTLDLSMMKEIAADLKANGKNLHATCLVNCCWGIFRTTQFINTHWM